MQYANPVGTDGFDFLEFTTNNPDKLISQFTSLGFKPVSKHKKKNITLYQQGDIRFLINTDQHSLAHQFANEHGDSASAMGFKVKDAQFAYDYAIKHGAKPYTPSGDEKMYDLPAIYGVGGSVIYFVDYQDSVANYANEFEPLADAPPNTFGHGLTYIDHVTHNLNRGNMDEWADFYTNLFNFREVRFFDIEGRMTGLKSRAMTSPCGKIRIPLNESSDDKSQIEEFIREFNGEGIQHIALGTDDIYKSVGDLQKDDIVFLDTPDTYYELIEKRLPNHGEPVDELKKLRVLIDGTTESERKLLLQIFTQNMLGPVFFEIIQRKGDEGFGEGNFRALFESIELDQIRRGVLTEE